MRIDPRHESTEDHGWRDSLPRVSGTCSRFVPLCLRGFSFLLLPLAPLLSGCGGSDEGEKNAGAGPKRQVVVFSPHGQEILDEFEAAFEAAHPDIDCVARFISTGQVLSALRIDRESPTVDVWWGGTSAFFNEAKADGLLAPYQPSWSAASDEGWHDPDHAWYAQFLQVPAIMFNAEIYKPEQMPATRDALLAPEWKDKIVIREPMNSGTMKTIFSGWVWALGPQEPAPGYEFLRKLDAQTRSYLPNPQALYDRIAKSREGYISLWNLTDIVFQAEANKYPFGYRVPDEPVPVSVDPIGLIAGGPNPEEAKLFYEFVTSLESCRSLARAHYRIIARTDMTKDDLAPQMAAADFTPMKFDPAEFDRMQAGWMDHWAASIRDPEK